MVPALTSVTHAARVYLTDTCTSAWEHCRAIRYVGEEKEHWEFICTRPVEICVHLVLGPERHGVESRTAFCEEHSIGIRHQTGMRAVTRMHSLEVAVTN